MAAAAAGDRGPVEEGPDSTRWGLAGGRAAGTADVGGQPYRVAALGAEEGEQIPSGVTSSVSAVLSSVRTERPGLTCAGGGYEPLAGCCEVGGCQWVGSWPWPPW